LNLSFHWCRSPKCSWVVTNSTGKSHSWDANSHSASQEITRLLWNPKVHYLVRKTLTLVPIQSTPSQPISFPEIYRPKSCPYFLFLHARYLPRTYYTSLPTSSGIFDDSDISLFISFEYCELISCKSVASVQRLLVGVPWFRVPAKCAACLVVFTKMLCVFVKSRRVFHIFSVRLDIS
jgi:hypothetical protein